MTFVIIGMAAIVGIFGLIPLKAAAEYRFRGKTGLVVEGAVFLGCAAGGLLMASTVGAVALLGAGIVGGVGIRQMKGNNQRYIE